MRIHIKNNKKLIRFFIANFSNLTHYYLLIFFLKNISFLYLFFSILVFYKYSNDEFIIDFFPYSMFHPGFCGLATYLIIFKLKIFRFSQWAGSISFGLVSPFSTIKSFFDLLSRNVGGDEWSKYHIFLIDIFCFGRIYFLIFITQIIIILFPSFINRIIKIRSYILLLGFMGPLLFIPILFLPF